MWRCRCERIKKAREQAAPNVSKVRQELFPTEVKAAVPPAMKIEAGSTYWGKRFDHNAGLTDEERKLLGIDEDKLKGAEARQLYWQIDTAEKMRDKSWRS